MAIEPEKQIEQLLRAYAQKRRQAGEQFSLDPATRRRLQAEVSKLREEPNPSWLDILSQLWFRMGLAFSILVLLALGVWWWEPWATQAPQLVAKSNAERTADRKLEPAVALDEKKAEAASSLAKEKLADLNSEDNRKTFAIAGDTRPPSAPEPSKAIPMGKAVGGAAGATANAPAEQLARQLESKEKALSSAARPSRPAATTPPPPPTPAPVQPGKLERDRDEVALAAGADKEREIRVNRLERSGVDGASSTAETRAKAATDQSQTAQNEREQNLAYQEAIKQTTERLRANLEKRAQEQPGQYSQVQGGFGGGGALQTQIREEAGQENKLAKDASSSFFAQGWEATNSSILATQTYAFARGRQAPAQSDLREHFVTLPGSDTNLGRKKTDSVLDSFVVERSGTQIRIIDADGSVYQGQLTASAADKMAGVAGETFAPEQKKLQNNLAEKPADALQQRVFPTMGATFAFRANGTNATLKQRVEIAGVLREPGSIGQDPGAPVTDSYYGGAMKAPANAPTTMPSTAPSVALRTREAQRLGGALASPPATSTTGLGAVGGRRMAPPKVASGPTPVSNSVLLEGTVRVGSAGDLPIKAVRVR